MVDQRYCPEHSGFEAEIQAICKKCEELKDVDKDQWTAIGKKASVSSITWGIGILVAVLMALFGAMFHGQNVLSDKIDKTKATAEVDQKELSEKLDDLKMIIIRNGHGRENR